MLNGRGEEWERKDDDDCWGRHPGYSSICIWYIYAFIYIYGGTQSWIVLYSCCIFKSSFTCFWWRFPEILWPKHPKGIQRAISLQSLVSQYASSVGRNASRNGLTCQMKVIIESPEKSSHDVWWILKILCPQTKTLRGTSPKIDEFYKELYIFCILTSSKLQVTCSSQEAHNLQLWWKSSRFPDPLKRWCCFFLSSSRILLSLKNI